MGKPHHADDASQNINNDKINESLFNLVLMALKLEPQTSVDKASFTETKKDKLAIDGNVDDA